MRKNTRIGIIIIIIIRCSFLPGIGTKLLACDVTESTAKGRMFAPSEQDRSGHDAVMTDFKVLSWFANWCSISGRRGSFSDCLLGFVDVKSNRGIPAFREVILPPFQSRLQRRKQHATLKLCKIHARLRMSRKPESPHGTFL